MAFFAFVITAGEVLATLGFLRFFFRAGRSMMGLNTPAEHPVERAARVSGVPAPAGFVARPKRWQHTGFRREEQFIEPTSLPPPDPQDAPTKPKPRWKPIKAN